MFVEKSGLGPFDGVRVTVDTSGAVEAVTGAASVGQGVETVVAQICADALGVDYRRINVVHGQTDRIAYGMGAFASRVTVMTGEATRIAATKLRDKALAAAAALLQSAPETLDIIDGKVVRKGVHRSAAQGPSVTLGEIARALAPAAKLLGDALPGLSAEGWFESHHMTYPYGVHLAVVRVDRGSGATVVERYVVAYDIGKAVNPMLVEGQIAGGVAQGIGGALFEEFLYRLPRRAAVGQLRRLSDADGARNSADRGLDHRGRAEPAQSARAQRRRRRRRQSRRRRRGCCDRQRARHARRRDTASGHAAAVTTDAARKDIASAAR